MAEIIDTDRPLRRVALAGASGLVGQHLLQALLADASVDEVHVLSRRMLAVKHPKLILHTVDFQHVPQLPAIDELYLALGTTIKQAGSQAAFRAVDYDANFAVARAAVAAGASRIALVSANGADAQSRIFYNRVKGELEAALRTLTLSRLVIAQPSLLLGDRSRLGQSSRPLERISMTLFTWLAPLLPLNWRAVPAKAVAAALLAALPHQKGDVVLSSAEIQSYARPV